MVPDEDELTIQSIVSVTRHEKDGRTYLLDRGNNHVLVWDAQGRFLKVFGEKGQGPGQFAFTRRGAGALEILEDQLVVLDGGLKKLHFFSLEGVYLRTKRFPTTPGSLRHLLVTGSNYAVINQYEIYQGKPRLFARIHKPDLSRHFEFEPIPHKSWIPKERRTNGRRNYIHNAFEPRVVLAVDGSDEIIFSHGGNNYFDVYDIDGKRLRRVSFALAPKKVRKETALAYRAEQRRNGNASVVNIPEYYPVFTGVDPLGELGYLISISDGDETASGILIDRKGKTRASFSRELGDGWMLGVRGHLFCITVDEDDNVQMAYLDIILPKK